MVQADVRMSFPINALVAAPRLSAEARQSVGSPRNGRHNNRFMIKGGIVKGNGKTRRVFAVGYIRMGCRSEKPNVSLRASSVMGTLPA